MKIVIAIVVIIGLVLMVITMLKKSSLDKVNDKGLVESKIENDERTTEMTIESKIEEYIKENGREYSKELISGENSFFVGGTGKSIKSYDVEKFKAEEFDIYGLIESVPEACNKFGAEVIIDDENIIVNIYTEKDKFYEKE